ncbi:hypothetical protein FIBSPDRAFT_926038 [Athelia psychrophila]|uniref:G-protein coupled receptors family 2 profile 2 domain-containing protein n=1 Tax=Athelia psychrophila TaxID=1759441 RepID=A0A166U6Y9_9AGAM|nr:hypothetical protein FIBSPDRAFT_926038 [Fibularhizoctonia sp. CBS 109695]
MLPYSAKLAWMILCTIGTICSWPVLYGLAKAINSWWISVIYGCALTIMVLFFDIGMIWRLNSSEFPLSFCLTQMVVTNMVMFILGGVSCAYYIATIRSALWPKHGKQGIKWSNAYLLLIIGLPLASTFLQMSFTIKLGAYKQTGFDSVFCGVTEPLWPKLLGYGGLPLIIAVATAVFTIFAVRRLQIMLDAHRKLWYDITNQIEFAPRPTTDYQDTMLLQTAESAVQSYGEAQRLVSLSLDAARGDVESAVPSRVASVTPCSSLHNLSKESSESSISPPSAPLQAPRPRPLPADGDVSMYGTAPIYRTPTLPPPPTSLFAEIWRLLFFQAAFIAINVVMTVSTLRSVSGNHRPSEFGSDHVAMALTAWGPVLVFKTILMAVDIGHFPSIRKRLMFWKR